VQEINIKLWYNEVEQDWTVEINGTTHVHVLAKILDELVEYAVVAAQQAILEHQPLTREVSAIDVGSPHDLD
jgi:hypothetical protein